MMPAKSDQSDIHTVFLRVTGGEIPRIDGRKIGPLGLSSKKVGDDIVSQTQKDWKGLRVPIKLIVQNRQAQVEVVPAASSLIIKALKEPPTDRKKNKNIKHGGDLSLDDIVSVASLMGTKSYASSIFGTIKEVLGTATAIGCTVRGSVPDQLPVGEIFGEKNQ
eukprot:gnl/MRDRNA2_/MRDRNA2_86898_c0_seq1.p1 gnl/MRDRNA2_/MRDRNA2_86898_c0~~gnl/MRDRNA2_/MRDRNA2_86898_c0_seq1.p1  ORF type:complete len:163 (-),score=19.68 gnl/MRDRNA2_/MRDRNA2_86898_c0_seq1:308-796(-)